VISGGALPLFGVGVAVGVVIVVGVAVAVSVVVGAGVGVEVPVLVDLPQAETTRETPINRASNKPNQRHVDRAIVLHPTIRF
jgi:hypothetical protein